MTFLLKNLELALDEQHLIVGEKLFEAGKMTRLFESERNLWIAVVDGFEIEIQVSPSRVKACSCECDVFLRDKMCGHLAAGLLGLRKHFSEKKQVKKRPSRKPPTYQKLTNSAVLEQVGKDDLYAFVRKYAKQNRSFSLALRTRFASLVPMPDSREKYQQLFQDLSKTVRKKNSMVSIAGAKQLQAFSEELLGQADDAIAMEHFAEGLAILLTLIEEVPKIIRKVEREEAPLIESVEGCFRRLNELLSLAIPPDLRLEVWDFLRHEFVKSTYRIHDLVRLFFRPLHALANDIGKRETLFGLFESEWQHRQIFSDSHRQALLTSLLGMSAESDLKAKAKGFLAGISGTFDDLQLSVGTAVSVGQFSLAKKLIVNGLSKYSSPAQQRELEVESLNLAEAAGDTETVLQLAKKFYLASGDLSYLRTCKQNLPVGWENFREAIFEAIGELPQARQQRMLPALFEEEKLLAPLGAYLLEVGSLDLLLAYDHCFLPEHRKELVQLYSSLLDDYLSKHFGVKPTEKLLEIFDHLRRLQAQDVVEELAAWARKNYPRRMELAIELLTL